MPGVVRLGDAHAGVCSHGLPCCPHIVAGVYVSASGDVSADGRGVVRVGDLVVHSCPHCGVGAAVGGSGTVSANGRGVHRVGDAVVYPGGAGVAITGSEDVNAG
jgi:uncharacterized Zn-binding protein involved in type VI secretion